MRIVAVSKRTATNQERKHGADELLAYDQKAYGCFERVPWAWRIGSRPPGAPLVFKIAP